MSAGTHDPYIAGRDNYGFVIWGCDHPACKGRPFAGPDAHDKAIRVDVAGGAA